MKHGSCTSNKQNGRQTVSSNRSALPARSQLAVLSRLREPAHRAARAATGAQLLRRAAARNDGIGLHQRRPRLPRALQRRRCCAAPACAGGRLPLAGRRGLRSRAVVAISIAAPVAGQRRAVDDWDAVLRHRLLLLRLRRRRRTRLLLGRRPPKLLLSSWLLRGRLLGPRRPCRLLELLLLWVWRPLLLLLLPLLGRLLLESKLLRRGLLWGRRAPAPAATAAAACGHRLPLLLEQLLLERLLLRLRLRLRLHRLRKRGGLRRRQRPRLLGRLRRRRLLVVLLLGRRRRLAVLWRARRGGADGAPPPLIPLDVRGVGPAGGGGEKAVSSVVGWSN